MSLNETPTGWTFTHGRTTYGPFATRDSAASSLYDLEHGRADVAAIQRHTAAYAALDAEDRPFADAITAWMERVDDRYRDMAMAGCILLEAAAFGTAKAQGVVTELMQMDEADRVVAVAFAQGMAMGYDQALAEVVDRVEKRQKEHAAA